MMEKSVFFQFLNVAQKLKKHAYSLAVLAALYTDVQSAVEYHKICKVF
jgi:hypothetical protein